MVLSILDALPSLFNKHSLSELRAHEQRNDRLPVRAAEHARVIRLVFPSVPSVIAKENGHFDDVFALRVRFIGEGTHHERIHSCRQ